MHKPLLLVTSSSSQWKTVFMMHGTPPRWQWGWRQWQQGQLPQEGQLRLGTAMSRCALGGSRLGNTPAGCCTQERLVTQSLLESMRTLLVGLVVSDRTAPQRSRLLVLRGDPGRGSPGPHHALGSNQEVFHPAKPGLPGSGLRDMGGHDSFSYLYKRWFTPFVHF